MSKKTSRLSSTLTAKQETLGYNQASDWWALGVLVYHMMTGFTPFSHTNEDRVKRLITSVNVCFPDAQSDQISMSSEVQDFILRCLDKKKETRLGAKDSEEILNHKWFADLTEKGKPSQAKIHQEQKTSALKPTGLEFNSDPNLIVQFFDITN